jgi:hypothetical protein
MGFVVGFFCGAFVGCLVLTWWFSMHYDFHDHERQDD